MRVPTRFCASVVLAGIGLVGPGMAAAQSSDPFLDAHRVAVARNLSDVHFEIRFKGSRSTFNPREPIEIELVFDPPSIVDDHPWLAFCRDGWPMSNFVLDRPDAASTPQASLCQDLAERPVPGVLSGRPGRTLPASGPPPPKLPPAVLTRTINDWYRFDRPGVYRVFVQSAHPSGDGSDEPRYTSNVLTFTLTARDQPYERARLRASTGILLADTASVRGRRDALLELRRLASDEAATALAHFYPPSHHAMSGPEEDLVMGGLLMVPDRAAAVAALETELRRPERQVSPQFVRDLASLEIARRGMPARRLDAETAFLGVVEHYSEERARALGAAPGRLQRAFREDLLDGAEHARFYRGSLGPVTHRHPREATAAFLQLPVEVQTKLLTGSWRRFAYPAFLPLVRRLALAPGAGSDALREIALRRWHALEPAAAAVALRRERASVLPRVSMETLGVLDEPAPARLQAQWIRLLSTSTNEMVLTAAAERLERFGTRAGACGAARVRRRRDLPFEASTSLIAFMLRVDRRSAVAVLRAELAAIPTDAGPEDSREYPGWLWQVGTREWNPAVERVAIDALSHGARAVREDALRSLGAFGSPAARGPVEAYLLAANARLTARADGYPVDGSRDVIDPSEVLRAPAEALGQALGWTLSPDEERAWIDRCATSECAQAFQHEDSSVEPNRTVRVLKDSREGERRFIVGGTVCPSEAALERKLSQYPRGTRFEWVDRDWFFPEMEEWTAAERAALLARVARHVAPHGIEIATGRRSASPRQADHPRPASARTGPATRGR